MLSARHKMSGVPTRRYACVKFCDKYKTLTPSRFTSSQMRRYSIASAGVHWSCHRQSTISATRNRSSNASGFKPRVFRDSQKASFWSLRGYPFWHRPGCTWVHSQGDPRQTPRDKDCPACQQETKRPTELSNRELAWQRQMQLMKEWIERDPYETIFGRSNDRLKGLWRRGFMWDRKLLRRCGFGELPEPWEKWLSSNEPSWRKGGFSEARRAEQAQDKSEAQEHSDKPKADAEHVSRAQSSPSPESSEPQIRAYGQWKVSSTDVSGKISETSGAMVYDPISMKMIPFKESEKIESKTKKTETLPANLEEQDIPVKKFGGMSTEQLINVDGSKPRNDSDHKALEAQGVPANAHGTAGTAAETKSKVVDTKEELPKDEPLGLLVAEKRLELIRSAERAMNLAQSQLKVLSVVLDRAQNRSLRSTELSEPIKSLQRVQGVMRNLTEEPARVEIPNEPLFIPNKQAQKEPVPMKEALESSWVKEKASKQRVQETASISSADSSTGLSKPSRKSPSDEMKSLAQKRMNPLLKRERALKHMTSFELGIHRAALLKKWANKLKATPTLTRAEMMLNEEIRAHKAAMAAFENKWNRPRSATTTTSAETSTAKTLSTLVKKPIESELCNGTRSVTEEHEFLKKATDIVGREGIAVEDRQLVAEIKEIYEQTHGSIHLQHSQALKEEQEKLEDRLLVAYIKAVYESKYGEINENHRQGKAIEEVTPSLTEESSTSAPPMEAAVASAASPAVETSIEPPKIAQEHDFTNDSSATYQVLAYDRTTDSVHKASASTSFSPPTGDRRLSFTDALERLHQPAKFLPFISKLHSSGYEIVSANKNLLVLKNTRGDASTESAELVAPIFVTPKKNAKLEKLSTDEASAAMASSTSAPKPSSIPTPQNPRVRKEEAVFTGRPLNDSRPKYTPNYNERRRRRRALSTRLFLFTGKAAFIAATLYLLGCIIEELRQQPAIDDKPQLPLGSDVLHASKEDSSSATSEAGKTRQTAEGETKPKSGFWAAVSKEQARRTEAKRTDALRKSEAERLALNSSGFTPNIAQMTNAAVDVALFSTTLWLVMKLLDWRS